MNSRTKRISLSVLAILIIVACSFKSPFSKEVGLGPTVKEVVSENTAARDEGIKVYQGAQKAVANYYLKVNSCAALMTRQEAMVENYAKAVQANTENWSGHFRAESEAMTKQLEAYANAINEGTLDPSQLNLAQLIEQGAFPTDLQAGLALYVDSVVQAPPPEIDSEVYKQAMDTMSECYSSVDFAGSVTNEAITAWNTWLLTTKGMLVSELSDYFGYPMPGELPLITGGQTDSQMP